MAHAVSDSGAGYWLADRRLTTDDYRYRVGLALHFFTRHTPAASALNCYDGEACWSLSFGRTKEKIWLS
jgi:hypothetical protein